MREDAGAFNGRAAFEVQAGGPGGGVRVVARRVAGTEIEDADFEGGGGRVWGEVVEGTVRVGGRDLSMLQYVCE